MNPFSEFNPTELVAIIIAGILATFIYVFRVAANIILVAFVKWIIVKEKNTIIKFVRDVETNATLVMKVIDDKIVLFLKEHNEA